MQYITAIFLWTGLATSCTVGASQGKPSSGKSNSPAHSGLFPHDQAASFGSAAGDQSGQPSAAGFGFGAPAFASAYGARTAAQASLYGTSSAGFGGAPAGYAPSSSGFSGAPAALASSGGFGGAPAGYAMSSSGPGSAPTGYIGEASNSGFSGSPSAFASSSGFAGAPAGYASSGGFGGAPAGLASSSGFVGSPAGQVHSNDAAGSPSSGYGANSLGMGAYASSPNGLQSLGSPSFGAQNGLFASSSEGFSGRNQPPVRSAVQEGSVSATATGVNTAPGALGPHSSAGGFGHNSAAGQYGYASFASAGNPFLGGSAPGSVHEPNAPQGSSPFGFASSGFAPAQQASFGPFRGYRQFGSSPPQFAAGLGRLGSSPSAAMGLKKIFKPYIPQGSSPGSALPSAPGSMVAQRKSDAKNPIGTSSSSSNSNSSNSNSNRFASSGRAKPKASSGTDVNSVAVPPGVPLKLKNSSRSLGSTKKDLSRKKSRKNKHFP